MNLLFTSDIIIIMQQDRTAKQLLMLEYRQDETNIMQMSPTYFPSGVYHPQIFPFHSNPDIPFKGDKSCVKMIQLTFSKKDTVNFSFPSSKYQNYSENVQKDSDWSFLEMH